IRAALASAQLTPADVDAVEAHGTGTSLGDPIEAQALLAAYGQGRPDGRPLWLGSVKSNIGHAQQAAGVAGVIKMVLALRYGLLPATLHADEPSPHVDWSAGDVRLLTEPVPWPAADGRPRRAGVSAFGLSGTNAHVILAEAPPGEPVPAAAGALPERPAGSTVLAPAVTPRAWVVSSQTAAGLAGQAGRLADWARSRPDLDPADIAWSLAATRGVFEHRAVVAGFSREDLAAGQAAVAAGQPGGPVAGQPSAFSVTGTAGYGGPGRVAFVFPGQGGQWAGMGLELRHGSPVFAARLAECSAALEPFTGWRVEDVLGDAAALERVDVVQPALWAVMVSLAAVWEAAGVRPDAVAGHSQGEIAAAVVAGILTLEDAAKVVALRSRTLTRLSGRGAMASLAEPADAVRRRLAAYGGQLSVAAENGPDATVVSGEPAAVAALAEACLAEGVRARVLPVDYASHGPQVEELRADILAALDGIAPRPGRIPMISALTGEWLDGPELDPGYWYASLRSPVEFSRAVRALAARGHRVFIETAPHPVLSAAITATLESTGEETGDGAPAGAGADPGEAAVVAGTLRRDDGGAGRLLASLAQVYVAGVTVDWTRVLPAGRRVELPTYAFQRQRYWARGPALPVAGGDGALLPAEARFWAAVEDGDLEGLTGALAVDAQRPFGEVMPLLASWRRRERDESAVAGWRYRVTWAPVTVSRPARLAGPWLLVVPARDTAAQDTGAGYAADRAAAQLSAAGARVVTVTVDSP
ncbi:MAG TPA: acyltransferase domain-containing protein, partial [Trebonia sp.]